MAASAGTSKGSDRHERDRKLLQLFYISFLFIFTAGMAIFSYVGWRDTNVISLVFTSAISSFILTGILAWRYNGKNGILRTRTVLWRFLLSSAVIAVFATAPLLLIANSTGPLTIPEIVLAFAVIYISMVFTIFFILLLLTVAGFGLVGLLTVYQRRHTGEMLVKVRDITPNTMEPSRIPREKVGFEYTMYRWLFDIPPSLDTRTLRIDPVLSRESFPWKMFWSAWVWMIFFSAVLAIYVSLNPFLLDISDFQSLFSVSSSLSLLVPMFILPWFIYRRLNARISGPVRDFKLFDGIRSRMVGTLVAFGTLIVFIRFALRDIDAFLILGSFAIYIIFFTLAAFLFTFVYFNYFEQDLSSVVSSDYEELTREPG